MDSVIFSGMYNLLSTGDTEYNMVTGGGGWTTTESSMYQIVSTGGSFKNLRVKLDGGPGGGASYAFTLMQNGSPTSLTCTIADTATTGSDTSNTVNVSAGDYLTIRCVPSGGPAARNAYWTFMFTGSTSKESLIMGGYPDAIAQNATEYNFLTRGYVWTGTEANYYQIVSTAGTLKNLYVKLQNTPNADTTFTLRKNGADTSLTVTLNSSATGSDTAHTVSVAAGDKINLKYSTAGTYPATGYAWWGLTFLADTDGESLILGGSEDNLSNVITEFNSFAAARNTWNITESYRYRLGQTCTLKNLYLYLSAAPGSGKYYRFTIRQNDADTSLLVTVSDTAQTGSNTSDTVSVSNDDYLGLECTPNGTPTAADAFWGLTCYIAPGGTNTKSFTVDSILKATSTKTFTSDAYLVATLTKAFTADAILQAVASKGFTVDAILKAIQTKTFTLDAHLRKTSTKPFTVDSILKAVYTKTFTADAVLTTATTKTFSVDALLKATGLTKTFTTDAYLQSTSTKTFTVDSYLQKTQTKTFSVDAYLQQAQATSFTLDAYLQATQTKTFTVDAILSSVATHTKTFSVDALLKATLTKTFTVDAIVGVVAPTVAGGARTITWPPIRRKPELFPPEKPVVQVIPQPVIDGMTFEEMVAYVYSLLKPSDEESAEDQLRRVLSPLLPYVKRKNDKELIEDGLREALSSWKSPHKKFEDGLRKILKEVEE